jgi:hypothetical protein
MGGGDVRVEPVPDARLVEPTDALVVVTRAAICGSDLWPYKSMAHSDAGRRIGTWLRVPVDQRFEPLIPRQRLRPVSPDCAMNVLILLPSGYRSGSSCSQRRRL